MADRTLCQTVSSWLHLVAETVSRVYYCHFQKLEFVFVTLRIDAIKTMVALKTNRKQNADFCFTEFTGRTETCWFLVENAVGVNLAEQTFLFF